MFRFLFGVLVGAAGYWIWQSFGRDLLGMGDDSAFSPSSSTYGGSTPAWSAPAASSASPAAASESKPAAKAIDEKNTETIEAPAPKAAAKKADSTEAAAAS